MAKKTPNRPAERSVPKVAVAPASPDGPNRKVRKEEARRQREALQRKMARRKYIRWGVVALVVVAAAAAGMAFALNGGATKSAAKPKPGASPTLDNMQTGDAPWNSGQEGLKERIQAIGLPFGHQETLAFHHHDLVQVYVDGKKVAIPAYVGINYPAPQSQVFFAVLHTHDASGIVHIESPVARAFTLGNFFDVWGVAFSSTNIGGYENSGNKQIRVFLNGKPYTGDPRNLPLTQHEDVVVTYGTKAQLPDPIPVTYPATISTSCSPDC